MYAADDVTPGTGWTSTDTDLAVLPAPSPYRPLEEIAEVLYWALRWSLEARDVKAKLASRIAERAVRQWFLADVRGHESKEAARLLGVTPRQARRDRSLLRTIDPELLRELLASRLPLPRIPQPPDRILSSLERVA